MRSRSTGPSRTQDELRAGVQGRVLDAQPEMAVDDAVVGQAAELDVYLDDSQGGGVEAGVF